MKTLKIVVVLFWVVAIASCKKETVEEPTLPEICTTCLCIAFDSTGVSESFSSSSYGAEFYYQAYTSMVGRYADHSMNMYGYGSVDRITVNAIWQAENSNFSGDILLFADADVKFDFDDYPSSSKSVSFDANLELGDYPFKIDGVNYNTPPAGITVNVTHLTNGKHITVSGVFTTIELGGWELAIDNMCVADYSPVGSNPVCEGFEDTAFSLACPSAQTAFGAPVYSTNGISFRYKYIDYEGISSLAGSVFWGAPNSYGSDQNVDFSGQLLQVNNMDLELDFAGLAYTNKRVSFDISNIWDINHANEFQVNGAALNTVPAGVSYSLTALGNATNGDPCYHVEIAGPIQTIILVGWENTYDNLCVEEI